MDEKKKYEIIGRVEIGTDEYRDLIEDNLRNAKDADRYRMDLWKEETEHKKTKDALAQIEKRLSEYAEFVAKDPERKASFNDFLAAKHINVYVDGGSI